MGPGHGQGQGAGGAVRPRPACGRRVASLTGRGGRGPCHRAVQRVLLHRQDLPTVSRPPLPSHPAGRLGGRSCPRTAEAGEVRPALPRPIQAQRQGNPRGSRQAGTPCQVPGAGRPRRGEGRQLPETLPVHDVCRGRRPDPPRELHDPAGEPVRQAGNLRPHGRVPVGYHEGRRLLPGPAGEAAAVQRRPVRGGRSSACRRGTACPAAGGQQGGLAGRGAGHLRHPAGARPGPPRSATTWGRTTRRGSTSRDWCSPPWSSRCVPSGRPSWSPPSR